MNVLIEAWRAADHQLGLTLWKGARPRLHLLLCAEPKEPRICPLIYNTIIR